MHRIAAKFVHAYLPDAKKPYNLRAVHQIDLDVHGIAGKAEVYNITTPPKMIEEGLTVGTACRLKIVTQRSVKHGSAILKAPREMKPECTLTAQTA